jgi:hypothetical protein
MSVGALSWIDRAGPVPNSAITTITYSSFAHETVTDRQGGLDPLRHRRTTGGDTEGNDCGATRLQVLLLITGNREAINWPKYVRRAANADRTDAQTVGRGPGSSVALSALHPS